MCQRRRLDLHSMSLPHVQNIDAVHLYALERPNDKLNTKFTLSEWRASPVFGHRLLMRIGQRAKDSPRSDLNTGLSQQIRVGQPLSSKRVSWAKPAVSLHKVVLLLSSHLNRRAIVNWIYGNMACSMPWATNRHPCPSMLSSVISRNDTEGQTAILSDS